MSNFPDRLRTLRELKGLTQSELADRIKLKPPMVSHLESGIRQPSLMTLRLIADVLGTSIDYLIGRSDNDADSQVAFGDSPVARVFRTMKDLPAREQEQAAKLVETLKPERLP